MIPQRCAEKAITLADQGWNLSAIARHLGHDRRTIRVYLNGRRKPGQPRPHVHSFAPFEPYAARRLRDDPHLRASGLHREVAELGYAGSYSTLTRELRNSGIATTCPACEHRPHGDTYPRTPIRRAPQSLPMRVAPLAGETIASYLGRLAAVNHLPLSLLLTQLPPWFTARTVTHDDLTGAARADAADVESLAALSGLTATTLLHALPGFRSGSGHGRPPVRATHACPRCAARHGHTEPVPVHLSAHQRLCARHRVWLGTTTGVDLVAAPEIIHAQRLASRLARRHTGPRLMLAEATALQQIIANQQDGEQPDLIRPAHHSARLSQPASRVRPPQPDRSSDLPRNDQQRRQRSHPVQLTHGSRPRAPPRHQTAIGPDSLARSTSNTLTGRLRRQPKR